MNEIKMKWKDGVEEKIKYSFSEKEDIKESPLEAIRVISAAVAIDGIDHMVNKFYLINLICRAAQGEADLELADEILERTAGIKIDWEKK